MMKLKPNSTFDSEAHQKQIICLSTNTQYIL